MMIFRPQWVINIRKYLHLSNLKSDQMVSRAQSRRMRYERSYAFAHRFGVNQGRSGS